MPVFPVTKIRPGTPSASRLAALISVGAKSKSALRVDRGAIFFLRPGHGGIEAPEAGFDMGDRVPPRRRRRARRQARWRCRPAPPAGAAGRQAAVQPHGQSRRHGRRDRLRRGNEARSAQRRPRPCSGALSGCWPVKIRRGARPRPANAAATGASLIASGRVPMMRSIRGLSSLPPSSARRAWRRTEREASWRCRSLKYRNDASAHGLAP